MEHGATRKVLGAVMILIGGWATLFIYSSILAHFAGDPDIFGDVADVAVAMWMTTLLFATVGPFMVYKGYQLLFKKPTGS